MQYDFSQIDDSDSFITVPAGAYACRIADVRTGSARDGSERWSFRLQVAEGEYAGRTAAWDSLTWSDRGLHRVKRVLRAFGIDVSGSVTIEPRELVGIEVRALLEPEEWEDPLTGQRQLRMRVPYSGYAAAGSGEECSSPAFRGDNGREPGD